MQTMQNSFIVDPFGGLYSCFEEAGHEEYKVGQIANNTVQFFPLRDVYKTRHLANMEECLKCSVALACGGQCPMNSRAHTGDIFKPNCDGMKETILAAVKHAYLKNKQKELEKKNEENINSSPAI